MARPIPVHERAPGRLPKASGFSLVELLVAVAITSILMAGLAKVFKSSVSTFSSSAEKLSSARRNRVSTDLLYEDLNTACMFLQNLVVPPDTLFSPNSPPFYVLPNVPVTGLPASPDGTHPDHLYFYLDQPLPFLGTLVGTEGSTVPLAAGKGSPIGATTFTVETGNPAYAAMVAPGQKLIFNDQHEVLYVEGATVSGDTEVTITTGPDPTAGTSGNGPATGMAKFSHYITGPGQPGAGVLVFVPQQMVRYSIQMLRLDPATRVAATPCLVRDQGEYSTAGFTPSRPPQVLAENVLHFKVYLSANAGSSWAGLTHPDHDGTSGVATAWTNGLQLDLDAQLQSMGQPTTQSFGMTWIRDIPLLVRADITTRTATQRAEFSKSQPSLAHATLTQSLVLVPRHFGLPMN